MYTNSTNKVRTKEGLSHDIPVHRGIKQGRPLSPLLFNLVLEGIIPQIKNSETRLSSKSPTLQPGHTGDAKDRTTGTGPRRHHRDRARRAKMLQAEYRQNRKKCFRSIIKEEPVYCQIPKDQLKAHFNRSPPPSSPPPPAWLPSGEAVESDDLTYEVKKEEVSAQLKRLPLESSPGSDHLSYRFWKSLPRGDLLLTKIFNICLRNNRVPGPWKESWTVLIHKKGNRNDPSNWRPISLQCTIYKVFTAVLAKLLAGFCIEGSVISPFQKGFMPYEGCFEHSFLMTSLFEDSKRSCKDLYVVWFDLKDAFGSVSHSVLFDMMSRLSLPKSFISLCRDIYNGSSSRIRTGSDFTDSIPLTVGVKQGCPLSPLLFNLAMQGMLSGLDGMEGGYEIASTLVVKYLAYADDMCIVAHSKEQVNGFITRMVEFMSYLSGCCTSVIIERRSGVCPIIAVPPGVAYFPFIGDYILNKQLPTIHQKPF